MAWAIAVAKVMVLAAGIAMDREVKQTRRMMSALARGAAMVTVAARAQIPRIAHAVALVWVWVVVRGKAMVPAWAWGAVRATGQVPAWAWGVVHVTGQVPAWAWGVVHVTAVVPAWAWGAVRVMATVPAWVMVDTEAMVLPTAVNRCL